MQMKIRKSFILLFSAVIAALLLACAFMLMPKTAAHADAEDTHDHTAVTWSPVNSEGGNLTAGSYYLESDIEDYITVSGEVTLCLNGHTITSNSESYVITVSAGATFTLCDCVGTGIIQWGVDGGVFVAGNAEFEMTGGTIRENCGYVGCGVCVCDNSVFKVSGAPNISGNITDEGIESNVYLSMSPITVTGELTEGAKIGITLADGFSGALTQGYGENNKDASGNIVAPDTYFVSDKEGYFFALENGEVILSESAATVTVDGVKTWYGTLEEAWAYANNATTAATVKMYADAQTTDTLTVGSDKDITLDLNGHMLKLADGSSGSVITVKGNFTLIDSEKDLPQEYKTPHKYYVSTDDDTNGLWIFDEDNGDETLYGGVITGSNNDDYSGGVDVKSEATFTMESGTIAGNYVTYGGGGVYVRANGEFLMKNGAICGNYAKWGGGVSVSGEFTMNGGNICGNYAGLYGGGVFVTENGTFTMESGTISGNYAEMNGGGVYVGGSFEISGAPIITGNKKDDTADGTENNVYLYYDTTITVIGKLEDGAQIGVYNTGEVATDFTQEGNPADFFIPDAPANNCIYLSGESNDTVNIGTHDIITHEAKQPTCTASGWQAYEGCSRCDYLTDKVEIPALSHNYGEWTLTKEATEAEEGEERRVCANDETHYETRSIPKLTPAKPSAPAEGQKKSYVWICWLLFPLALAVGGTLLGVWLYKKNKKEE